MHLELLLSVASNVLYFECASSSRGMDQNIVDGHVLALQMTDSLLMEFLSPATT
jgi:hypothetical protein